MKWAEPLLTTAVFWKWIEWHITPRVGQRWETGGMSRGKVIHCVPLHARRFRVNNLQSIFVDSWHILKICLLRENRLMQYDVCAFICRTHSLPLMGFWCRESTKLRGFSMVYLTSRTVCVPPPSLHKPFLEDFDWSSNSQSLAWSGLVTQIKRKV